MKKQQNKEKQERLVNVTVGEITEEMKKAYIDYAMSVIVSRALPSVEDGLKPVQRRILYAMHTMNLMPDKATKKTARIVGEVLGKFHPHGDAAVYDALVRLAQDFSMRYPLVFGQGNFGSIDGDPPAAMRYTEAKLSPIALELLYDINKNTVQFVPNFDNSTKEPTVLPAKLPNLLINGSSGIAVGLATNIPPHNLCEVIDAIVAYINKPSISIDELMKYIKGPDFPTGGVIFSSELEEVYKTGRGKITVQGIATIEQAKGKKAIVIKEIPYQVNKTSLINEIVKLIETKKISDVADIKDESTKKGIRVVIYLRKNANEKLILNNIIKHTSLRTSFNVMMVALVKGVPKLLNLKELIKYYVEHRVNVVKKRAQYDLTKARQRLHLVEGFIVVLTNIDKAIDIIKKSKNVSEATEALVKHFKLTRQQAAAVLDMKLSRLTKLEHEKLVKEKKQLEEEIKKLEALLKSEKQILAVIKNELIQLKKKYGDERRTKIKQEVKHVKEIELVKKEQIAVIISYKGYINAVPIAEFNEQRRGGKGIIGSALSDNDFVQCIIACSTHDKLVFITNRGNAYRIDAYKLPKTTRYGKGKHISNFVPISNEKIKDVLLINEKTNKGYVVLVTKKGMIKKLAIANIIEAKKTGIRIIKIPFDDEVVAAVHIADDAEVLVATAKGMAVRFNTSEVREMQRNAYGVRAIKLKQDSVVGMIIVEPGIDVLTITQRGYGKRTNINEYRLTKRDAKGIVNIKISERNGKVVAVKGVKQNDSIIVITKQGMMLRFNVSDIRTMGRATQGVKIINLKKDDEVVDAEVIKAENTTNDKNNTGKA